MIIIMIYGWASYVYSVVVVERNDVCIAYVLLHRKRVNPHVDILPVLIFYDHFGTLV